MNIEVQLKGPISVVTGPKMLLEMPEGSKISDILKSIRDRYVEQAREIGLEAVFLNLRSQNLVLVDGREISALQDEDTPLKEGEVIHLVNFTHGG